MKLNFKEVAHTLEGYEMCLADCVLVVEKGYVHRAEHTGFTGGMFPRERGKVLWHPFERDEIVWPSLGEYDCQDYTWVFSLATFRVIKSDAQKLIDYIAEHCGQYAIVDGSSLTAKPGLFFMLSKFHHNCGNSWTIVAEKKMFIATVGEDQESSGRGESWKDKESFETLEEARAYVCKRMRETIGFRMESCETEVVKSDGYAKYMKDGEFIDEITLEQLEEWLDELDGLDDEDFSFFWSIKEITE
jgi:hypothetical protein